MVKEVYPHRCSGQRLPHFAHNIGCSGPNQAWHSTSSSRCRLRKTLVNTRPNVLSGIMFLHDACLSLSHWTYAAFKGVVGMPQEIWEGKHYLHQQTQRSANSIPAESRTSLCLSPFLWIALREGPMVRFQLLRLKAKVHDLEFHARCVIT